jgi:integrase
MSLGAFAGLRPSETVRIRCGDLRADNRLPIGLLPGRESEAKNHASRRLLPIPWPVAEAMHRLAKGRPANEPLLITRSPASDGPQGFTPIVFNQCFAPMMERVTGRRLPIKCLRKSFATWILRAGYDRERLELFLGHETKLANSITGRHYTAELHELLADELEPMAKGIGVAMEPYMFTQLPAEARS